MDQEIARIEHSCGNFDFVAKPKPDPKEDKKQRLHGCIDVCSDVDGCNKSDKNALQLSVMLVALIVHSWYT